MFILIFLHNMDNYKLPKDFANRSLQSRVAILSFLIHILNAVISEIQSDISFLSANPEHPDNQYLTALKRNLTVGEDLSGQFKVDYDEAFQQLKWQDQTSLKKPYELGNA